MPNCQNFDSPSCPGPYSRNPFTPPKKKFPGEVRGYQPSGAKQTGQYKTTGKPSRARQTGQDSPQEQEALLGCFRKLRLPLGMTSQGPSQGPSATASTSTTWGQAARMASMAKARGAACPRRVSVDKTRQSSLKCSCGHNKTDIRHSWP